MGKRHIAKMKYKFLLFFFAGEMKSCSLNVKLLIIQSAHSVSKQGGLAGASGVNLQQIKLKITVALVAC